MELNAAFSKRVAVHAASLPWVPSPIPGVERRMLDRIGGEIARATSIVRYAPQSSFSPHVHEGGEEFLVLEGVFSDEQGDYPAGTYVRNPPTSAHAPGSSPGCTIFVKLWQFDPADRAHLSVDTSTLNAVCPSDRPNVEVMPLYQDAKEHVRLERWRPDDTINLALPEGGEFFVLSGSFEECGERFESQSWLRMPCGAPLRAKAGPDGCNVWVKTGHMRHVTKE